MSTIRRKAKGPLPLWTYTLRMDHFYYYTRKVPVTMSIEFLSTAMASLFVGVWLLVGHIISVDHF
ncbi:MAG: hypothetical protein ACK5YR_07635 [Pirellula sp.]|jgi:hypothetical protein